MESLADVGSLSTLLAQSREAGEVRTTQFQQKPTETSRTQVINRRTGVIPEVATEQSKEASPKTANPNEIWDDGEILTEDALLVHDDRPAPKYEFSYKQSVGTQDTFLGLSDKTPLTSDCTHLVVYVLCLLFHL